MERSGVVDPKFIRFLTDAETNTDEMKWPREIVNKYAPRLEQNFLLKFRNGYEIPVVLNDDRKTICGLTALYEDFHLKGGDMLVFEFNGDRDFNVYVIGNDLTEIDYPGIVHHRQKKRPRVVSMRNGGLRFVSFVKEDNTLADEFEPPASFKRSCPIIRGYQRYLFSNGKKIEGGYNHQSGKFHGIRKFWLILGIEDLSKFNLILFTYEEDSVTTLSVFNDNFIEVMFPGTPISPGFNSHNPTVSGKIEIHVQPCHMYKYSYGVDISIEFERISTYWMKKDYITAYSGDRVWMLQVRTRTSKQHRCGILDGWIKFREDLGLDVGDVVVMESADYCRHHFSVKVIKNQNS